jgi:hypothetical protein
MHGAAAKLNFPLGAAPAGPDSEPDESEADAARLQDWQDRGKLFLQPLPAPRVEDAVVQYFASAADQGARADAALRALSNPFPALFAPSLRIAGGRPRAFAPRTSAPAR